MYSKAGFMHSGNTHLLSGCRRNCLLALTLAGGLAMAVLAGCASRKPTVLTAEDARPYASAALQPGDLVRINFPGAPNLNTEQPVLRDGSIALPVGGELKVAGKSPAEIEKELLRIYEPQLVVKEVTVTTVSAGFPV